MAGMRTPLWCCGIAIVLTGCGSGRVARYDEFEKARVERLCANAVNRPVFARTVVCLNAAIESFGFSPFTNITVQLVTNPVVTATTNLTVTTVRQQQTTLLTNLVATPGSTQTNATDAASAAAPAAANPPNASQTSATSRNESLSFGPNQSVRAVSMQTTTTFGAQTNEVLGSVLLTRGLNEVLTTETNEVVTLVTNLLVSAVTNVTVRFAEEPLRECYLFTEIAPPDFPLAPGESLVVLADGVRYTGTPATPRSGWTGRRGFLTTWYRVSPETLLAIAKAREVKLRIRGANGTLERTLNRASHERLRRFALERLAPGGSTPEGSIAEGGTQRGARGQTARSATAAAASRLH